jgi:hypothetical protein
MSRKGDCWDNAAMEAFFSSSSLGSDHAKSTESLDFVPRGWCFSALEHHFQCRKPSCKRCAAGPSNISPARMCAGTIPPTTPAASLCDPTRPAALHRVGRSPARMCAGTFFETPSHPRAGGEFPGHPRAGGESSCSNPVNPVNPVYFCSCSYRRSSRSNDLRKLLRIDSPRHVWMSDIGTGFIGVHRRLMMF